MGQFQYGHGESRHPRARGRSSTRTRSRGRSRARAICGSSGRGLASPTRRDHGWCCAASYGLFYAPIGANYWAGVPYSFAPGFFGINAVAPPPDGAAAFNWDRNPYAGTFAPAAKDPAYTQWGMVSVNPGSLQSGRMQNGTPASSASSGTT